MPIGPLVPGVPTTVTPDASPQIYTSSQGPAPDGPVVADDILAVHQMVLNVSSRVIPCVPGAVDVAVLPVDLTCAVPENIGSVNWTQDNGIANGARPPRWTQSSLSVSATQTLYIPISNALPYSGKFTAATVRITPANNHIALPSLLPRLRILAVSTTDSGNCSELADSTDAPASVAAYNAPHQFGAIIDLPYEIQPVTDLIRFWLALECEGGTNAINGLILDSAWIWIER